MSGSTGIRLNPDEIATGIYLGWYRQDNSNPTFGRGMRAGTYCNNALACEDLTDVVPEHVVDERFL